LVFGTTFLKVVIYMLELDGNSNTVIKNNAGGVIIKTSDVSRVIVTDTTTEIANKLKTSAGILGLATSFSYTSDMIGYSFVSDSADATFTSGAPTNHTVTINTGVWLMGGGHVITKGSGTFDNGSYTNLRFSITTGTGTINRMTDMSSNPIPSGATMTTLSFPITAGIVICTSSPDCVVTATSTTGMTVGTTQATRYTRLILTRIA
jgi:hypothetical protein